MPFRRNFWFLALAGAVLLFGFQQSWPWHPDLAVRKATCIVIAVLILWISEIAPLGVTALAIPIVATLSGVLLWNESLAAWGDPIIFLFLGTFLLARALDKHGVLDQWARGSWWRKLGESGGIWLPIGVMMVSGAVSTLQNNTAVTAMFLPVVMKLARKQALPAISLLALAYGATFGGMATPVGTAPNFIGYRAMKELDAGLNFVSWLKVGMPVWIGTSLIAWFVLCLAMRFLKSTARDSNSHAANSDANESGLGSPALLDVGPTRDPHPESASVRRQAGRWAQGAFALTAAIWLGTGLIIGFTAADSPLQVIVKKYLPEALIPMATAWCLFVIPVGRKNATVLDRHDFQALDWDTLFLIAGGLCLGKMLDVSGTDEALAQSVQGIQLPSFALMLILAGATVILSELTSNTATASLMVPIAGALAVPLGISPVNAIWLVALSASLGFALPVSTPPNALVYGTRKVPLRLMIFCGVTVDVLCTLWVVLCIYWLT